jgi:hypothetical protein
LQVPFAFTEAARLLVVGSYRPVDVIVTGHPLRALIQELRVLGAHTQDLTVITTSNRRIAMRTTT